MKDCVNLVCVGLMGSLCEELSGFGDLLIFGKLKNEAAKEEKARHISDGCTLMASFIHWVSITVKSLFQNVYTSLRHAYSNKMYKSLVESLVDARVGELMYALQGPDSESRFSKSLS